MWRSERNQRLMGLCVSNPTSMVFMFLTIYIHHGFVKGFFFYGLRFLTNRRYLFPCSVPPHRGESPQKKILSMEKFYVKIPRQKPLTGGEAAAL